MPRRGSSGRLTDVGDAARRARRWVRGQPPRAVELIAPSAKVLVGVTLRRVAQVAGLEDLHDAARLKALGPLADQVGTPGVLHERGQLRSAVDDDLSVSDGRQQ